MMRLRSVLLAASVVLAMAALAADAPRMVPVFRHSVDIRFTHPPDFEVADLDGDGAVEVTGCRDGFPTAFGMRDGQYQVTWRGPHVGCYAVAVGDLEGDGGIDVVAIAVPKVLVLDPRSLGQPRRETTTAHEFRDIAIGNVDADPAKEIVAVSSYSTIVFDAATMVVEWAAAGYGGSDLRIADVDGNAANEIIVNGETGYVLDATAQTLKWEHEGGFGGGGAGYGNSWTTGNADADAKDEILFADGSTMNILSADTFTTVTWAVDPYVTALAVGDADGDGTNEVVIAHGWYAGIHGRNAVTGALLWEVFGFTGSVFGLRVANLDGDDRLEVVSMWSSGAFAGVSVSDAVLRTHDWSSGVQRGGYFLAAGDLNGDGRNEYVVASGPDRYSNSLPRFEIFDARTGRPDGMIEIENHTKVEAMVLAQADADPAPEIVAIVDGYLMSWDGATRQLEFTSRARQFLLSLTAANIDGDAVDELIVGTYASELMVLNGASNIVQKSMPLSFYVRDTAVADLDGDADLDLVVAADDGLSVYDTSSWQPLGSAAIPVIPGDIAAVEATSAGGGTVAVRPGGQGGWVFKGASLVPAYACPDIYVSGLAFGEVDGETRLIFGNLLGPFAFYPLDGPCPEPPPPSTLVTGDVGRLSVTDADGDGRNDLIISGGYAANVFSLGTSSEVRGDVDGNDVVTMDDLDAAADYVLGLTPGLAPSGDANTDERFGVEDLFLLIDHELGSGAALPESALPSVQ
jgi:hypothetical protein